jgi:hypothetical protein
VGGDVQDHARPDDHARALEQEGERERRGKGEERRQQGDDEWVAGEQVEMDCAERDEREQARTAE